MSAAISDFSHWSVNDKQSLFIVFLHIVTGFYQRTHKIHGNVCVKLLCCATWMMLCAALMSGGNLSLSCEFFSKCVLCSLRLECRKEGGGVGLWGVRLSCSCFI